MSTSALDFIHSKREAFDFLDDYAFNRKEELDKRQISANTGFIKSYMLETEAESDITSEKIEFLFDDVDWKIKPLSSDFARVSVRQEDIGFVEVVSSRHIVLHSILKTDQVDRLVLNTVKTSLLLDSVWLSGYFLNQIWDVVIKEQMRNRYVKFKFEHKDIFDDYPQDILDDLPEDDDIEDNTHSSFSLGLPAYQIADKLSQLKTILPDFNAMQMLRIPATERGGYDFWDNGKVTHRSQSFKDGRQQINWVIEAYQRVTEIIEERVWLYSEENEAIGTGAVLNGEPVTLFFPEELSDQVLINFIKQVFENNSTDFRLWGKPLYMGNNTYQVYGIDMHLWQQIYLELSKERFLLVLPKGTCGNTVHRLVNNVQRFLSPHVIAYIGDTRYDELITNVLRS